MIANAQQLATFSNLILDIGDGLSSFSADSQPYYHDAI
jgi:hypothetical protein